jgi:hypothetical protein
VYQERHGEDMDEAGDWYRPDSFTGWNDSVCFNDAVGDLFLDIREDLPVEMTRPLEEFLVAFCPRVADESEFAPPQSPGVQHEAFYAALAPEEVKRRLELLDGVDLSEFFARIADELQEQQDEVIADQQEVVEFFFMWAAALGQAASKGWGLVVIIC